MLMVEPHGAFAQELCQSVRDFFALKACAALRRRTVRVGWHGAGKAREG